MPEEQHAYLIIADSAHLPELFAECRELGADWQKTAECFVEHAPFLPYAVLWEAPGQEHLSIFCVAERLREALVRDVWMKLPPLCCTRQLLLLGPEGFAALIGPSERGGPRVD